MKDKNQNTKKPPRGGTQKSRRDQEIERLRRELERERRHSAKLEREVSALRRELQEMEAEDRDNPFRRLKQMKRERGRTDEKMRSSAALRASHYRKGSYLRYLFETVAESFPVQVISQLVLYLRRLRVVRMVVTIVLAVGAVVLVSVLSAAALPFLLVGTAVLFLLAWLQSRHMNDKLKEALAGRHIRVLVPERGVGLIRRGETERSFFIRQAVAMAAEEGVAVLVISPYLLSGRGLGGKGAFFTARREETDVYLVRRHYYFILRRRVLDVVDPRMTVIY